MEADLRELIADPGFRAYHEELLKPREFNTFTVLRYSSYEIRHSNVLAWLLRPDDTHGIGTRFLEWFADQVKERLVSANAGSLPKIGLEAPNVAVWRERDYVDITVLFKKEKCVVAIENKTGPASSGHRKQVERYERKLRDKYEDHTVKSVLLTTSPDGSVSFPGMAHVGWDSVHKAVGSFLADGYFHSSGVRAFVRQYLDVIERWIRPTGSVGFRALLDKHRSILTEMRQILDKDGDEGICGRVPRDLTDYRGALVRLVQESRQDPKKLRRAVARYLRGRGCETRSSNNPKRTYYWLRWTDANLVEASQSLGGEPESLSWSMTFTHQGVWVGFYLYQHPGKEQVENALVDRLKRFIRATPINRQNPDNYSLKGRGYGWERVYYTQLLSNDELAEMSAPEVTDEVMQRLEHFMDSDESEYRRVGDYFQCLAFRPNGSVPAHEAPP